MLGRFSCVNSSSWHRLIVPAGRIPHRVGVHQASLVIAWPSLLPQVRRRLVPCSPMPKSSRAGIADSNHGPSVSAAAQRRLGSVTAGGSCSSATAQIIPLSRGKRRMADPCRCQGTSRWWLRRSGSIAPGWCRTVDPMSAQPTEPQPGHDVIHVGTSEAVVVPMGDYLRFRAIERHASADEIEEAEIEASNQAHERWGCRWPSRHPVP
jgi:hypothetical protein